MWVLSLVIVMGVSCKRSPVVSALNLKKLYIIEWLNTIFECFLIILYCYYYFTACSRRLG